MKIFFTLLAYLAFALHVCVYAQVGIVIKNGAAVNITQNATVVLNNTSVNNQGVYNQTLGSGTIKFTGSHNDSIYGAMLNIHALVLDKPNAELMLRANVSVDSIITFKGGLFDIGNNNITLGLNGKLIDESETSRITTSGTGYVIAQGYLNNPMGEDLGNLGSVITSTQLHEYITVERGNKPVTANGLTKSIDRFYNIMPEHNSYVNATLGMHYFTAELNGLQPTNLSIFKNTGNSSWAAQPTTLYTDSNYAQTTVADSFSTFTLAEKQNALAVTFTNFSVMCKPQGAVVYWQTAQQANVQYFQVQAMPVTGGNSAWAVIATVAPQSGITQTDNYTINTAKPIDVPTEYRIAEYDYDGAINYSSIQYTHCIEKDVMAVYPNPAINSTAVTINSISATTAALTLYDAKGGIVQQLQAVLTPGYNNITINLAELAKGAYVLKATWPQNTQSVTIIKN